MMVQSAKATTVVLENTMMEISTGENLMRKRKEKKLRIISANQGTIATIKAKITRIKIDSLTTKEGIGEGRAHQRIKSQEEVFHHEVDPRAQSSPSVLRASLSQTKKARLKSQRIKTITKNLQKSLKLKDKGPSFLHPLLRLPKELKETWRLFKRQSLSNSPKFLL